MIFPSTVKIRPEEDYSIVVEMLAINDIFDEKILHGWN